MTSPNTPTFTTGESGGEPDTITALATPPGRGGIAMIRVSGKRAKNIMVSLLGSELTPRHATHLPFQDALGERLDDGVALFFPGPHSFTGEDVLELHGHGGPVVVDMLLQRILGLGARLARPGEFSERAFLNGKLDLAQAEAIADLINASSQQAARSAIRSLQGEFSNEILAVNQRIIHLRMYVEAAIDFTDEEIDFLSDEKILADLNHIKLDIAAIQQKAKQGSLLREGIHAVIIGEPNVGKSSLLNALSGKETAIVADIPGTTRDVLRDAILIDGMPMHLIDTAGLRESSDPVEQEGIRRAYQEIEKADIILYVFDSREPSPRESLPLLAIPTNEESAVPVLFIRNKIDLIPAPPAMETNGQETVISLSAKSGLGIDLLKKHIKAIVGFQLTPEGTYLARRRHLDALERSYAHIDACLQQLTEYHSGELAAEDLRLAQRSLGEITGEFTTDDLLACIFSSFCVGK